MSEPPNWETYNNFRTQDQGTQPVSWLPDVLISAVHYCADCESGQATMHVVVDNQGLDTSGPVDLVITSGTNELVRDSVTLMPQESRVMGPYTIAISDWPGTLLARIDADDVAVECDEDNNSWDVGQVVCD